MCGRIVYGSYGFVVPGNCASVSLAVTMAFRAKAVVVAKAFGARAVRAYRAVAMALSRQNCESESRR